MPDSTVQGGPSAEARGTRVWLITFTDLVALMLTFFVMLFAMSSVKTTEWRSVIDSLSQTLRPSAEKTLPAETSAFNIGTIFRKRAINLDYLASVLHEAIAGDPLLATSHLMRLDDRLVIALPGDLVFDADGATPTDRGGRALFQLGGVLRNIGNRIAVHSYSPAAGTGGGAYASEWELSVARAAAVANALSRSGYTDDVAAFGFGDGRLEALPGLPEGLRPAMARRVDIIISPEAGAL